MKNASVRVVLFTLFLIVFAVSTNPATGDDLDFNSKMLIQKYLLNYVRTEYVDAIDSEALMDGAIKGMIEKLDPHSSYMPPQAASDFQERIQGGFAGIGITFAVVDDFITVIDIIKGGPSEAVGLKPRDKIIRIDGEDAKGLSLDEIRDRLRGRPKTRVAVLIERPVEEKPIEKVIIRNWVEMNSVSSAYMLDDTTGYIALSRFTVKTRSDVERALRNLKAQGMERLVFDLRNNSGGSLEASIGVVNLFLKEGTIVYTEGRRKAHNSTWKASGKAPYHDLPMIVMINHGSASASEIVAGALQDHDRALIVGQTSFGKGLVMNPIPLRGPDENNSKNYVSLGTLVLSVSRYYTPSGRLIQRPYAGSREEYIREGFDDIDPNAADSSKADKPVYYTDLGRDVYGGGGITPDVSLPPLSRLNPLERAIRSSNLCFEFADKYLVYRNDIPENFEAFLSGYRIPAEEFDRFEAFIRERGVNVDSLSAFRNELEQVVKKYQIPAASLEKIEQLLTAEGVHPDMNLFARSIPFIEREIRQEIARMIWGSQERYRVWHQHDTELSGALACFEQAEDLLTRRLALKSE